MWNTNAFDALGRVISLTTPDSAVVSTSYSGNAVTVTDQAGKARKSVSDALGRTTALHEDPSNLNYQTTYTYDVLDNLTSVTQGVQTRTFTYDSFKRLTLAANAESGNVSYVYDNNGNLTSRVDGRSVTTTMAYDALNRLTSKSYNDNPQTPTVNYFYDAQSLPSGAPSFDRGYSTGRLVGVTYGGGSAGTYRGYDQMGRVLRQYQRTDSINYLVEASYYVNGSLQNETYPSVPGAADRRVVAYTNDNAGRLASLSSSATTYAPAASVSSISYASHNGLKAETYGNGLIHAIVYNNRLQPSDIKLGTGGAPTSVVGLVYNYGTTNNNGNVQSTTYNGGGLTHTQSFGYDALNRLTTSLENSGSNWSQTNGYDRYGNRWIDLGGGNQSLYFTASNNRITGWSYDNGGNLLNDGNHLYTYDGENKIRTVDTQSAYVYDGEGRRVRKLLGGNLRFVYGIGGKQIAEFDGATGTLKKEYIYGADGLLATIEPAAINSNGTRYATSDSLGSPRVVTNSSAGVVSRHDYMPFGEEIGSGVGGRTLGMGFGVADGLRQKFTSKERDTETGLDYFSARYYGSSQGRFTSPDPLMASAHTANPQTWNRYTYALNNPLKYVDPDGMKPVFREYKGLTEAERRILNNSTVTFGKGNNAVTFKPGQGEALYNHMKQNEQKQLAGLLNMTAGLADIQFADGSKAIDYVQGITGGNRERIYANVDGGLKAQMETTSAKKPTDKMRFIGPSGQAVSHASGGIDYDVTFRENLPNGPMQLSFATKENFTRMDMDMDEHCQNCGDASAEAAHIVDGVRHKFNGGTNPEYIHKRLTLEKIYPSYEVIK